MGGGSPMCVGCGVGPAGLGCVWRLSPPRVCSWADGGVGVAGRAADSTLGEQ